jgi:lysophospholipase L1-like esterase
LSETETRNYKALRPELKDLFLKGHLNPGLFRTYVGLPDIELLLNDPSQAATKLVIRTMDQEIKEMKAICDANGCKLIFVNLPFNYFTGHRVIRNFNDTLNTYLEEHNKVDSMYRAAASVNGLPYIELTSHFRSLQLKTGYFFLYDGHPTAKGYNEIARDIAEQLPEITTH